MKILKGISALSGFFIPLFLGRSIEMPDGILLVWICFFSFGIMGKLLLQAFEKPFLNIPLYAEAPHRHLRILNLSSVFIFFIGLGSLIGEVVFYQNIGALPITLIIFGISIYLGAHYINLKKWFFNQ